MGTCCAGDYRIVSTIEPTTPQQTKIANQLKSTAVPESGENSAE